MWGGVFGCYFSSLCADACENPPFADHKHRSVFLPVGSCFPGCPPHARFSKTANEADPLPGGAAGPVMFQPPNAHSRRFIRAATFGNCSLGTQSSVCWKEENKTLPLTSILGGFGSAWNVFLCSMFFVFLFWMTFSPPPRHSLILPLSKSKLGHDFGFPGWACSICNGNFS